jgi:hypothetical protein
MFSAELVVVNIEEMPDAGGKIVGILAGETVLRPIALKSANSLQPKPLKLATRMPVDTFRRRIRVAALRTHPNP